MGKKAVVLSGGGAKGGYQIGVWKVLRQMGFTPDIVVGTSVGALNGALMALDNFDAALDIWENMSMDSVFQNFVNMSDEENPDRESYIKELAKEAIFKGGADYTPLQERVKSLMDEEKLRTSPIRFGLVTTMFPKIKPVEVFIEDIPEGKAADYVLASAAAFPFMKSYKIGESAFVDGGYSDNMPVKMAIEAGADDIVVVNIGKNPGAKFGEADNVSFKYISSKKPLNDVFGGMLMFDGDISRGNIRQGELDAYKAYDLLDGYYYAFKKYEKYKIAPFEPYCAKKFDAIFSGLPSAGRIERGGRESVLNFLRGYDDRPFEFNSNVLYCAETAGDIFGINTREEYTVASFDKLINENATVLTTEEYGTKIDELTEKLDKGLSLDLLKMVANNFDKKFLLAYTLKILLGDRIEYSDKRRLWLIADIMPQVFCAALYCCASILNAKEHGKETQDEDSNS